MLKTTMPRDTGLYTVRTFYARRPGVPLGLTPQTRNAANILSSFPHRQFELAPR
jgi:hypothetical protein